jgi:isocitrate dehydrogenase (NAD+)
MANASGFLHLCLTKWPTAAAVATRAFHASSARPCLHNRTQDGKIKCTLIPGDGVGPELMDSVQEVVKALGIPIEFEQFHLSEVSHVAHMSQQAVMNEFHILR